MRLLLVLALAACGLGSLERRARDRIAVLKERLAEEQGRRPPLIVPIFGPDDVAADGSMEGNDVAPIDELIALRRADGQSYPMRVGANPYVIRYAVYNFKHETIARKLIEAARAGIVVQVLADAGNVKSRRFEIDDWFAEAGVPFFKDRKLMPADFDREGPFFSGVKASGLMHNKMRLFEGPNGHKVLFTGSLNPGTESMMNEETLFEIRDERIFDRYRAFFDALKQADADKNEKSWVNEWKDDAAINVLFSPSEQGFDIAEKILDWIDEEQEFIFISVFSLNLFSGKRSGRDLLTTLKRAKDRGVMIWIVTDRKQSDGPSGFGRPFDDLLRKELGGSTNFVMYEVINDVGRWNAMHFKDAIFGVSRVKIVTDTANWSSAAMGSCFSATKTGIKPKEYCSKESSTESTLFIDGKFMPGGNKFGFRMLKNHLGLLDKYYRQIDVQGNGDPTPAVAWERLVGRFPSIPFQRTTCTWSIRRAPANFWRCAPACVPRTTLGRAIWSLNCRTQTASTATRFRSSKPGASWTGTLGWRSTGRATGTMAEPAT